MTELGSEDALHTKQTDTHTTELQAGRQAAMNGRQEHRNEYVCVRDSEHLSIFVRESACVHPGVAQLPAMRALLL